MKEISSRNPHSPQLLSLVKTVYLIHLFIICIYSFYLIFKYKSKILSPLTITLVMIIIYGFMLIWIFLINYLLIICKQYEKAVIMDRVVAKIIIMVFPIFGLLSINKDHYLDIKPVLIFIVYMGVVCLVLIVYEIICCVFLQEKHPAFLFEPNDFTEGTRVITQKRNQFNDYLAKN